MGSLRMGQKRHLNCHKLFEKVHHQDRTVDMMFVKFQVPLTFFSSNYVF